MNRFFFVVQVIFFLPIKKYFTYLCPKNIIPIIGCRVLAPFGNKKLIGIIVDYNHYTDNYINSKFKIIYSIIDNYPIYNKNLWRFLEKSSIYYHCSIGYILFHAFPIFLKKGQLSLPVVPFQWSVTKKGKIIDINMLKNSPCQYYTLSILRQRSIYKNQLQKYKISYYSLTKLKEKKLCYLHNSFQEKDWKKNSILKNNNITLTSKEHNLVKEIFRTYKIFKVWLLMGIHELSKNKIYITLISKFLHQGLQILIIVPNIKNIYQNIALFKIYFNVPIDMFHSNLTNYQKISVWCRAKNHENAIIVGTKKSIFIPFAKLGIIIFNSEHTINYKNTTGWLYHARDLSLLRAVQENIPILLESITPSLETLYNITYKKWELVCWEKKSKKNNIIHQIIDIKSNQLRGGLSISLIEKIHQNIDKNHAIVLIMNNNDFIYFILSCDNCGKIASCVKCNEFYLFHKHYEELLCNFCILKVAVPKSCFYCGSYALVMKKFGIHHVKKSLKNIFLNVPILCDYEKKNSYYNTVNKNYLQSMYKKPYIMLIALKDIYDINFFNIYLVGILSIDSYLTSMNFRAIEKLSQFYINLIEKLNINNAFIEILTQTFHPNHSYLTLLMKHNYLSLSKILLHKRKVYNLPPFTYHVFIIVQSINYDNIEYFFSIVKKIINDKKQNYKNNLWMMGPFPDLFASYKSNYYIYKLLLQDSSRESLYILLQHTTKVIKDFPISRKVKWSLDIDPINE